MNGIVGNVGIRKIERDRNNGAISGYYSNPHTILLMPDIGFSSLAHAAASSIYISASLRHGCETGGKKKKQEEKKRKNMFDWLLHVDKILLKG